MTLEEAIKNAENQNFSKAISLFKQSYLINPEVFTNEIKYLYAKSLDKDYKDNKDLDSLLLAFRLSNEIYMVEPKYRKNTNLFMWLTYKCYVSSKKQNIKNELRLRAADFIIQHTKQEKYSPYEITVNEIIKFLEKETPQNLSLILSWHNLLDPLLLSINTNSFQVDSGETFEGASELEKWHVKNIKLLFESEQYEACIVATDSFIGNIQLKLGKIHHNNDIWCQRRKAQSLLALKRIEEANLLLQELVQKFPHSTLHYELMKISQLNGDVQQALIYGAEGLLDRAGQYKHKLKILKSCAEILKDQKQIRDSYAHYALIQKVRELNKWRLDPNATTEMNKLKKIDDTCKSYSNKDLIRLWGEWTLQQYEISSGIIKVILPNQKSGFITSVEGIDYYFNIKNVTCGIGQLKYGTSVKFLKKPSFDRAKNQKSIEAIKITLMEKDV